jgi:ABC-type nitrate/sulfonate/bicarbonate transport system substrate-binding protein
MFNTWKSNGRSRALGVPLACAVAATALIAAGCGSSDDSSGSSASTSATASSGAAPAKTVKVKLVDAGGLKQGAYIWDLYAAIDNGNFKNHGVDVSVIPVDNGALSVQAITAGAADVAGPISADSFINGIDQGAAITLAGLTEKAQGQFIAKNSIKTWADLKGKKVGSSTPALTGSDLYMIQMMQLNGIKKGDVHITSLGASDAKVKAVKTGAVDATMLSAPYNQVALEGGGYHVLGSTWDSPVTSWPFIGLGFSKKFESAHPDTVKGFMAAIQEAHDWLLQPANKDKAVAMLAKYTDSTTSSAAATYKTVFEDAKSVLPKVGVPDDELTALLKALGKPTNDLTKYQNSVAAQ